MSHFLRCLMLLLATSVASAQSILLSKPNGQQWRLPIRALPMTMNAQTGDLAVSVDVNAGAIGDGWCPDTVTAPPASSSPALVLMFGNGLRYRIGLSSSVVPLWRPSRQEVEVRTLSNQGQPGDGWCPNLPVAAPTFSQALQASPSSVAIGASTVLRWTSQNASTCSSSGSSFPPGVTAVSGWSATLPLSSSGTSLSLNVAGTYRFRIACTGTGGSVSSEASVTVSAPPVAACSGTHAPPAGRTQQTNFLLNSTDLWLASNGDWPRNAEIDLTQWQPPLPTSIDAHGVQRSFLGPFGRNPGDTGTMELKTGFYAAFRIDTTGFANRAGQLGWEQPGALGAPLLVSISPCPGDFFPSDSRCKSNGLAVSGLGWTTGAAVASYCPMTAGQTYYLNIIFGSPSQPGSNTCSFSACRWLFTQSCQLGCSP